MDATGQIIYKSSPTFRKNKKQNININSGDMNLSPRKNNNQQQQQPHSYDTITSSSTTTSYTNSDEIGETLIGSFVIDDDRDEQNGSQQQNFSDRDVTHRFDLLQQKVEKLTENQASQAEQYKRTRHENELLLTKLHSLDDQLRDLELNSETRAKQDEKKFREITAKNTRIQKECEQHMQTICQLQNDLSKLKSDLAKNEVLLRSIRSEREKLEFELADKNSELNNQDTEMHKLKNAFRHLQEEDLRKENIISILNEELEEMQSRSQNTSANNISATYNDLDSDMHNMSSSNLHSRHQTRFCSSPRTSITSGFEDECLSNQLNHRALKDIDGLEMNLSKMKDENRQLKQLNEELQAQLLHAQLEEGRCLVQEGNKSYSLADEMGEIDVQKLMKALKEQQDENARMRRYIDEIVVKIMYRDPELLDKTQPSVSEETNRSKSYLTSMAQDKTCEQMQPSVTTDVDIPQ